MASCYKHRSTSIKLIKYNRPADLQLISWIQPNIDCRNIAFADNIMRRWNIDYFYEILTYSWSGNHGGRVEFPKRNSYSPVPKICNKLGLKQKDSYFRPQCPFASRQCETYPILS